jgi:hypothetical protein
VVHDHDRPGLALVGAPDRLGQRSVAATETALRASRRACSAGSRSRNLVALIDWPAPVHMKAAMTTSQSTWTRSTLARRPSAGEERHDEQRHGEHRPAQAAAMVAVPGLPVSFQITARSIRPPSSGRPGSRLKSPTTRLAHLSWLISVPVMVPSGETDLASGRSRFPRPAQRQRGPGRGDQELPAGRLRFPLDLGEPAERVEQDAADRQPVAAGDDAVAQLVHQHGQSVEQHDEGRRHHVAGGG